jgi:hypothetical protein
MMENLDPGEQRLFPPAAEAGAVFQAAWVLKQRLRLYPGSIAARLVVARHESQDDWIAADNN